jgi:integrase
MPTIKFTKRSIEAMKPAREDIVLRDTELKGFLCKVTPKGRRIYYCYYRTTSGQERRPKIGAHGELTVVQARDIAREMLGAVRKDSDPSDPSTDRKKNRAAPDVEALGRRYFIEYADRRHKPRYLREQKRMFETKVIPALGKTKVAAVTHDAVVALHNGLMATPFEANRVLSLVRGIFKHAILCGLRRDGANPCQHVRKFREWKRDRLLTDDEVRRLHQTLDDAERDGSEHRGSILAVRLLFGTACRIGELIALERDFIRWELNEIHWPDTKTGFLIKPLTEEVRGLLEAACHRPGKRWVLSSATDPELPLSYNTVQKAFRRLSERAGIVGATLHSIRHRCATEIANTPNIPIRIGMQLTGHKTVAIFMGYVHSEKEPIKAAAEQIADARRTMIGTTSQVGRMRRGPSGS